MRALLAGYRGIFCKSKTDHHCSSDLLLYNKSPQNLVASNSNHCSWICNLDGAQWGSLISGSCGVTWLGFIRDWRICFQDGALIWLADWSWLSPGCSARAEDSGLGSSPHGPFHVVCVSQRGVWVPSMSVPRDRAIWKLYCLYWPSLKSHRSLLPYSSSRGSHKISHRHSLLMECQGSESVDGVGNTVNILENTTYHIHHASEWVWK